MHIFEASPETGIPFSLIVCTLLLLVTREGTVVVVIAGVCYSYYVVISNIVVLWIAVS